MNRRKLAFQKGLTALRAKKAPLLTRPRRNICAITPRLYNAGVPELNQIIQGDSTKVLNEAPRVGSTSSSPIPRSTSVTSITATTTKKTSTTT